jgi:hypothetical protein
MSRASRAMMRSLTASGSVRLASGVCAGGEIQIILRDFWLAREITFITEIHAHPMMGWPLAHCHLF